MSSSLRVIVVCTALVSWLPAQAQFLGPGIEFNVALTKQDLTLSITQSKCPASRPGPLLSGAIRSPRIPVR